MHIQLESNAQHAIEAYSETEIRIQSVAYHKSVIVSPHALITDWPVHTLAELTEATIEPLLTHSSKIILIGHNNPKVLVPTVALRYLATQQIALESMSIGAACRTFNVLLSEGRDVVLGVIFALKPNTPVMQEV